MLFWTKAILSGLIIALVSYISKKMPTLGALIVSLPLVSLLAIFWMWYDGVDTEKIAVHSESTFWFALPSMPLFLLFPWMLRQGWEFGPSILLCCLLTMAFYMIMVVTMRWMGFDIL